MNNIFFIISHQYEIYYLDSCYSGRYMLKKSDDITMAWIWNGLDKDFYTVLVTNTIMIIDQNIIIIYINK